MNNKKKYIIAIVAFIVCSFMFTFAIKAQRMYANKVTNQETSAKSSQSKSVNSKDASKSSGETKKTEDSKTVANDASKSTSNDPSKDPANKNKEESKPNSNSAISNSSPSSTNSATEQGNASKESAPDTKPNEEATFVFIDTVNGNKTILQKPVDMEGETVGYITCKLLDEAKIKYRTTGSASTLYFAAIDGLEEKKAGRLSGWCYYVKKKGDTRFHKPNIGSGQWIYKKGDLVVWKYLADGIHDGYSDDWDK